MICLAARPDIYRCNNQLFESGAKIPDEENCQCYYHCNYRQQPCYECCNDGEAFHPKRGCVLVSSYKCVDKPPRFACPYKGLVKHEHCRKYWDCRGLLPVEEACAESHHWDDQAKVCRKDSEVERSVCE